VIAAFSLATLPIQTVMLNAIIAQLHAYEQFLACLTLERHEWYDDASDRSFDGLLAVQELASCKLIRVIIAVTNLFQDVGQLLLRRLFDKALECLFRNMIVALLADGEGSGGVAETLRLQCCEALTVIHHIIIVALDQFFQLLPQVGIDEFLLWR
jgi:hypothetical protein